MILGVSKSHCRKTGEILLMSDIAGDGSGLVE